MTASWTKHTIRDMVIQGEAEIKTGPFGTQLHASDYVEVGIPMINARNIGFGDVRVDKLDYLSEETVNRLSSHLLKPGDIVFGRKGTVERHAFIRAEHNGWFQGTDCLRLRFNSLSVEPRFVSYCFMTELHQRWMINQSSHGATMTSLNQDIISRLELLLPPLPTQRKIAAILSAYDDLIENNTRRIRLLEDMAQALYREWFVHFRFPGHAGVKRVEVDGQLVPEGWEVVAFTDIVDVLGGGTPKTTVPEYWNGDIPFFSPKDASTSFYVLETEKHISELGLRKCNSQRYPKNTVFITARGTVGKVVMPSRDMAINQTNYALRGRDGLNQYFVFFLTHASVDHLKQSTHGAVFDTIIVDTFRRLKVIKPSRQLIDEFCKIVTPIMEQTLTLLQKNSNLRHTRDLLLPKLVSGALDVAALEIAGVGDGL